MTISKLTQSGSTLDRLMRDPDLRDHAMNLRDALDGAFERSMQSGLGKWVPAPSGGVSAPPGPTNALGAPPLYAQLSGDSFSPSPEGLAASNRLGVGGQGFSQVNLPAKWSGQGGGYSPNFTLGEGPAQSASTQLHEGVVEPGPTPPPAPGMVWQYDPGMQGVVQDFRSLRTKWKNLKTLDPIIDDTSGLIDPAKLASRVATTYKRNAAASASMTPEAQQMLALGQGDNFIPSPPKSGGKWYSSITDNLSKGLPVAAVALAPELSGLHIPSLVDMLGAGTLYGGGQMANAALNNPSTTSRLLASALAGDKTPLGAMLDPALVAGVHLWNEPEEAPKQ